MTHSSTLWRSNDKKDALQNQVASTQLNIDNHFSNSPLLRL